MPLNETLATEAEEQSIVWSFKGDIFDAAVIKLQL